jgi:hypothetical protein
MTDPLCTCTEETLCSWHRTNRDRIARLYGHDRGIEIVAPGIWYYPPPEDDDERRRARDL